MGQGWGWKRYLKPVTKHNNKLKEKNFFIDAEKLFNKIQHLFMAES